MAVRSKMSTARTRMGRAVVKTTTGEGDLPKEKPKEYSNKYRASTKEGVDYSIADITPDDEARIRKQYRIPDNEDFVITKADYDVYKNTGKKSQEEYGADRMKGINPFQANYEGEVQGMQLQMYEKGKAPKPKPDPDNIREAAKKVKPLDKFAVFPDTKKKKNDIAIKEKAAKEDIMVPEQVEGPKGRTVTRKTIGKGPNKRTAGTVTLRGNAKSSQTKKSFSGTKQRTKEAKDTLQIQTVSKSKGPRVSERMKYKKEEKLAGARERVLGMHGVALEDQVNKYGQDVKRGEKLNQGSAQRLKEIKNLYASGDDWKMKVDKINPPTAERDTKGRTALLKEAKADIKEVGKLSRGQVKATKAASGEKGRAMVKAKAMKEEYKTAKKPVKFSKDDTDEVTAKKVAASKERKTPAQLKEMKTAYKSATKEARGMTRTKEEKAATRSAVKATRGLAKEARSYKGDVRKGLRMEKKDALAMKVADKASEVKKARKTEKGKTMRGTSYFSMSELNKTIPLSKAANVDKYKEAKLTGSDKRKLTAIGKVTESNRVKKSKARDYSSSQGTKQAGARRFSKK